LEGNPLSDINFERSDISFHKDKYSFSYRVAGILVRDGKVLLQKPKNASAYAFIGGQVAFGETHSDSIKREWHEEVGADVEITDLKWVEENIFPWGDKTFQQICLSYIVELKDERQIPLSGNFISKEYVETDADAIYFYWIPLHEVKDIEIYPANAAELLSRVDDGVEHLIYREDKK
jgi:ADP-ribose pyrophosphatase YjhB (NUDIX family)